MSLFKKTYDNQKDPLRMEFILEKGRYTYFYGNIELSDNDLTRRTRKYLENENSKLQNDPDLLNQKIHCSKVQERTNFLRSKGYSCTSFEYLGQVNGTMSGKIESFLNNLISKETTLLGIHRVKQQGNVGNVIEDILTNGLILNGHTDSGVGYNKESKPDLSSSVSFYPDNKTIIKELMYANEYKSSTGSILIEIPDSELNSPNLFYFDENSLLRLNPKYIVGFVPVDENHHINTIIKSSDLNKTQHENNMDDGYDNNIGGKRL